MDHNERNGKCKILAVTDVSGQSSGSIFKGHAVKLKWTTCSLNMEPIRCPETSVIDYQSTLRNISEERRFYLHREERLKSLKEGFGLVECEVLQFVW
jgi:hypothetical protein